MLRLLATSGLLVEDMSTTPATDHNPINRRWILLGMAVGVGVGALPALIPKPLGPFLIWVGCGVYGGSVVPATMLTEALVNVKGHKIWWTFSIAGAIVGGVAGAFASWHVAAPPEWGLVASCTCGFLGGYFIVDGLLRRLDARNRERAAERDNSFFTSQTIKRE